MFLTWFRGRPTANMIGEMTQTTDQRRNTTDDGRNLCKAPGICPGNRDMRAQIVASRRWLEATNERGDMTRLEINRTGSIHALDWEGGLRGNLRPDRIEWENGTTWMRQPVDPYGRRR